jgi:hypothetical protein
VGVGVDFGFFRVDLSPSDVVISPIVEATTGFRLDLTSIFDVRKVFWDLDMV